MAKVDFWALERPVQERFVATTEGAAAPAPLAIRPLARDSRSLAYSAFGVLALLGGIAPVARRFRRSEQSLRAGARHVHCAVCRLLRAVGVWLFQGSRAARERVRGALPASRLPVPSRRDRRALARDRGATAFPSTARHASTPPVPRYASNSKAGHFDFPAADAAQAEQAEQAVATVLAYVTAWPTLVQIRARENYPCSIRCSTMASKTRSHPASRCAKRCRVGSNSGHYWLYFWGCSWAARRSSCATI